MNSYYFMNQPPKHTRFPSHAYRIFERDQPTKSSTSSSDRPNGSERQFHSDAAGFAMFCKNLNYIGNSRTRQFLLQLPARFSRPDYHTNFPRPRRREMRPEIPLRAVKSADISITRDLAIFPKGNRLEGPTVFRVEIRGFEARFDDPASGPIWRFVYTEAETEISPLFRVGIHGTRSSARRVVV